MTASQSSLFVRQDDEDLDGASAAAFSRWTVVSPVHSPTPKNHPHDHEGLPPASTTLLLTSSLSPEELSSHPHVSSGTHPHTPHHASTPSMPEDKEEEDLQQLLARARRRSLHSRRASTLPVLEDEEDEEDEEEEDLLQLLRHSRRHSDAPRPLRFHRATSSAPKNKEQEEELLLLHRSRRHSDAPRSLRAHRALTPSASKDKEQEGVMAGRGRKRRQVEREARQYNDDDLGDRSRRHRRPYRASPSLPLNLAREWCLSCAKYLAISAQFICVFPPNSAKCERCTRWKDPCVPVPAAEALSLENLLGLHHAFQVATGSVADEYRRRVVEAARALPAAVLRF
ncbi:hypothetical protein V500_00469 [Pseudogymnoascus sp. VKM F-4518 (FW-2643)]|nr:hypothetical protein V500_00469 [Pseudogymnoascus sp. VKM F-4518 (FW-2643)]